MRTRLSQYFPPVATAILFLFPAATPLTGTDRTPTNSPSLGPGRTITARHRANETFRYEFPALADHAYLLEIEQRGVDLVVTVTSPDGVERSFNSPLHRKENEIILVEAEQSGVVGITIGSEEFTDAKVGHAITLSDVSYQSTQDEAGQLPAWRAMTRGAELNQRADEASWRAAIGEYLKAATLWRKLGTTAMEARAWFSIGMIQYWGLWDYEAVVQSSAEAEAVYRSIGYESMAVDTARLRATALMEIGLENRDDGNRASQSPANQPIYEAIRVLEAAREFHRDSSNAFDVGTIINNIGLAHFYLSDWGAAATHWNESMEIFAELGERSSELQSLSNLAIVDDNLGQYRKAIEKLERVLNLIPPGKAQWIRGYALINLAAEHKELGNIDDALKYYSTALDESLPEQAIYRTALSGLGETYFSAGQFDLAEQQFNKALPLVLRFNDVRLEAHVLRYLGNIAYLRNDFTKALAHHQTAHQLVTSPTQRLQLETLMANDLIASGEFERAIEMVSPIAQVAAGIASERNLADANLALGRALLGISAPRRAEAALNFALTRYEEIGLKVAQAEALQTLAEAAKAQRDYKQAIDKGAEAIELIESMRGNIADPELRGFFLARRYDIYELQVSRFMDAYRETEATDARLLERSLETAERARARVTADLIAESASNLFAKTDPSLLRQRQELLDRLAELKNRRNRILSSPDNFRPEELQSTIDQLAQVEHNINLIDIQIRRTGDELNHPTGDTEISIEQIRRNLEDQSALLQYSLGRTRSIAWVVTRQSLIAFELPPQREIESLVRSAIELLREATHSRGDRERLEASLERLSTAILRPILTNLDKSVVHVAPDGALHYIPFGVLPTSDGSRFMDSVTVTTIPSTTVLAMTRRSANRPDLRRTIAIFADPVFEPQDARLMQSNSRTDREETNLNLTRLPWTEQEAVIVENLVPTEQRLVARGFDASRQRLMGESLSGYRILHLATHGLIDTKYPELSSLVLSLYDRKGESVNGLVRLNDIYGLSLSADLVVLSACDTALGLELRGEGFLGLTQGFLYAGGRNLLTSLWRVPDRATAELMRGFYGNLLGNGLDPATALRNAQRAMAGKRRWRDPHFWGAFVLVGLGS